MDMSNFYVKSDFKGNFVGHLNPYLNLSCQCCSLKLSDDLSTLAHLNGVGATRFSLIDAYIRI